MTLASIGTAVAWPGISNGMAANPSIATLATLDAAGEYQCFIFQAREAMSITHVGVRFGTATGSPTVDIRIETVADGAATGTLWATDTNITTGAITSNAWLLSALTATATIAAGDFYAVKIVYASGTSIAIIAGAGNTGHAFNSPFAATNVTGSVVKTRLNYMAFLALGSSSTAFYSIDSCIPGASTTSLSSSAFNNTDSAKKGVLFQVPFKCRCVGIQWYNSASTLGNYNISIRNGDATGAEVGSSSTAVDGDNTAAGSASQRFYFDNAVELAANTAYRAVVEPSSATNVTLYHYILPSNDYSEAVMGGPNFQYTAFATATWTDTDTQVPIFDILIDQLDDGAGGGMTAHVIGG